jgi:hypothetical protein
MSLSVPFPFAPSQVSNNFILDLGSQFDLPSINYGVLLMDLNSELLNPEFEDEELMDMDYEGEELMDIDYEGEELMDMDYEGE